LDERDVSTLGSKAYFAAAHLIAPFDAHADRGETDILGTLATQFARLMAVLRDVSDTLLARTAKTAGDWARLLEKWLTQRSEHLERLLRAQGIYVALGQTNLS